MKYDLSEKERKRALGAVATPPDLVSFMVSLVTVSRSRLLVLEPACGNAPFLHAFAERHGTCHEMIGVDIDQDAVIQARHQVPFATILEEDFLLWQPNTQFDVIICNPPYGIIGDTSRYPIYVLGERKRLYRHRFQTWQGKFNVYGAFIEHSVNLLRPDGQMVFVVPSSWMILDSFAGLRKFLADTGHLEVYYAGSVFPSQKVTAVILVLRREKKGLVLRDGIIGEVVLQKTEYSGEMIRFETSETMLFERQGVPLGELVNIRFAARSLEFRCHPYVSNKLGNGLVPILTGRNLKPNWIDYETCHSGLWMPREEASSLRFFYAFPHVVVGHTKGARVVAALDERCYPWREELHLVPKVAGLDERALTEYLNCEAVQWYVRTLYRDLVPRLTIHQLKQVPIPSHIHQLPSAS